MGAVPNVQYPNQILDTQIMQAIDAQLALKGLSKADGENADLIVCYQAAVNQENSGTRTALIWEEDGATAVGVAGRLSRLWRRHVDNYHYHELNDQCRHIEWTSDAAAKNQIWRGAASKRSDQEKAE